MNPNTPYYIDRHPTELSLDGEWHFTYVDAACDEPWILEYPHSALLPASTYRCLERAGILPDPYFGANSKLYEWIDKKVWYFTRSFALENADEKDVFLCFDGVGYTCRVWLNGQLLCEHKGMFGGPVMEVGRYIQPGENVLYVEVLPSEAPSRWAASTADLVPWNLRRDKNTSNGDFIVFGIWRSVRLEILPKTHLSRPYLFTKSIENHVAKLRLSVELADVQIAELDCVPNDQSGNGYCFAYSGGLDARPTGQRVRVKTLINEKHGGAVAYSAERTVDILDKKYVCADGTYRECQFFEMDIEIQSPRLWWPNGLGEPELYSVTLELYDENGLLDMLHFDTGIRTVVCSPTAGLRHRTRWDDFHFVINGRPIFLKGMNWQPIDFLLDCSDAEYRWALELVKNEGVQLLRVWSGGGIPEDDRFYALCDELGILVIQDSFPANQTTEKWDLEVLQSQVCLNLYRIRNHPSLALYCGGNEINPYDPKNAATMWVISREIADLDPPRKFWRSTPDKGGAHIYLDMEPVWYRKIYGQLPLIAESGTHSFPNAKSIRQQISKEEYERPLSDFFSNEFPIKNPDLRNHFSEFNVERIPIMTARASMINNVHGITLPDLCEATQIASCEFYQIMVQAMRENYPVTCGILPWCFKRPWTTTAIQLVDGLGEPIAPYYYVKNAYAPLCVEWALREVTYAPLEQILPDIRLLCDDTREWKGLTVGYEIYSPELKCVKHQSFACDISPAEYQKRFAGEAFALPQEYTDKYFFLRAYVKNSAGMLHQSVYWCKVLSSLAKEEVRAGYRKKPQGNVPFENGPWLKPQLCALQKSKCSISVPEKEIRTDKVERRAHLKVRIENQGELPIFPVKLEVIEDKTLAYADDNYFFLPAGACRELSLEIRVKDEKLQALTLELAAWNTDTQLVSIEM